MLWTKDALKVHNTEIGRPTSRPAKIPKGLIFYFWGHVLFKAVTHVKLLHNDVFSHTSDIPPCREQLWDKSISHGFHDLQLCTLYLAWLKCKVCEKMHFVWFSMWDGFLTTRLRIPPSSRNDSGGIRRLVVRKIHLTWKTIQNAYPLQDRGG